MAEQQEEQEGRKRGRQDGQEEPEPKRLCESLLCEDNVVDGEDLSSIIEEAEQSLSRGILDDDDEVQEEEQGLLDETQQGLVSDVMRSLEEELGVSSESSDCGSSGRGAAAEVCCTSGSSGESRLDFGYLLEASDDELGIEPSPSSEDKFDDTTTEKLALVEAEDLVRGESWDNSNWSAACAGFTDDDGFMEEGGQQQEWLKRTLEMFMASSSASASASVSASSPTLPMFEPTTPLLEAGVIL